MEYPEAGSKDNKSERSKQVPQDPSSKSVLTVVRRSRQEAEQFTAELLALEESDANSKEMDAMFSNILQRFFVRKLKYIRNFDDVPMSFINDIARNIVVKHKTFKLTEAAKEMMSIYDGIETKGVEPTNQNSSHKRAAPSQDDSENSAKKPKSDAGVDAEKKLPFDEWLKT